MGRWVDGWVGGAGTVGGQKQRLPMSHLVMSLTCAMRYSALSIGVTSYVGHINLYQVKVGVQQVLVKTLLAEVLIITTLSNQMGSNKGLTTKGRFSRYITLQSNVLHTLFSAVNPLSDHPVAIEIGVQCHFILSILLYLVFLECFVHEKLLLQRRNNEQTWCSLYPLQFLNFGHAATKS